MPSSQKISRTGVGIMRGDATAEYMRLATSRGCKIGKATKLRLVAMEDWPGEYFPQLV